jgi:hypothetical protein
MIIRYLHHNIDHKRFHDSMPSFKKTQKTETFISMRLGQGINIPAQNPKVAGTNLQFARNHD